MSACDQCGRPVGGNPVPYTWVYMDAETDYEDAPRDEYMFCSDRCKHDWRSKVLAEQGVPPNVTIATSDEKP